MEEFVTLLIASTYLVLPHRMCSIDHGERVQWRSEYGIYNSGRHREGVWEEAPEEGRQHLDAPPSEALGTPPRVLCVNASYASYTSHASRHIPVVSKFQLCRHGTGRMLFPRQGGRGPCPRWPCFLKCQAASWELRNSEPGCKPWVQLTWVAEFAPCPPRNLGQHVYRVFRALLPHL